LLLLAVVVLAIAVLAVVVLVDIEQQVDFQ
jgi:hypothetical protein